MTENYTDYEVQYRNFVKTNNAKTQSKPAYIWHSVHCPCQILYMHYCVAMCAITCCLDTPLPNVPNPRKRTISEHNEEHHSHLQCFR